METTLSSPFIFGFISGMITDVKLTLLGQAIVPLASRILLIIIAISILLLCFAIWSVMKMRRIIASRSQGPESRDFHYYLNKLNAEQIKLLLVRRKESKSNIGDKTPLLLFASLVTLPASAQISSSSSLLEQPGILITLILIIIPLVLATIFFAVKINRLIQQYRQKEKEKAAQQLADYLIYLEGEQIDPTLLKRSLSLDYKLEQTELSGIERADDPFGMIQNVSNNTRINFVSPKKKSIRRPNIDPQLSKLVLWYLGTAIFWLIVGTSVGEYLGIKFVSPDVDQVSWLSFGRLRPVHTNAVFWGWSSLAMIGLGSYVVSVVSNTSLVSIKKGWIALILINASVLTGSTCLMAGINNGGGEYREYVWPVMLLFAVGLLITLVNFIQTIAKRTTREIYISNWYIVSSIIFTIVLSIIAYWPTWQNGLGETIIQGYYMHQGVGMWFMLFNLGLVYYFLPQQLNKPIYSYSLGILAFWTQIIFYTLIGTHHFVFSSIPWWLQTVAIVGSMGMLIPVLAGTINFLMSFKGDWNKVGNSYTLPFYVVGIVFYFTGSFQGTAEAFRYTNLLWHFTDFTVAHSHIAMYGTIAFLLWASIYAIVPRLTGNEPPQSTVGAHFWLAFIGLVLYSVPLMIGGTLKGLSWMAGKPFIESVVLMAPYWLWRAIGGSLMWLSHLFLAYNFYRMAIARNETDIVILAFEKMKHFQTKEEETPLVNQKN